MRNAILRCFSIGAALALGAAGCGGTETTGGDSSGTPPPALPAPEFPSGTGQAARTPVEYPPGPYGVKAGSIVENYKFVGFQNPSQTNNTMQEIELADFYNPHFGDTTYMPVDAAHDDRLYAPGSLYAGQLKPKAIAVDVASVWCGPCNAEAKTVLPPLHAKYKPMGGEFMLQLADGPTVGIAADPKSLFNWTQKYKVDFPAAIDPSYKPGSLFAQNAYPMNMIVDTRTMKIVQIIAGVPAQAYWDKFEALLKAK